MMNYYNQMSQFGEISSWRAHDIIIEPHEVYTLNLLDTKPNIFVVNNPNQATLKIGITAIPRPENYEFKVEYNTTETFGRPIGTNNLYILNDSGVKAKIHLFSIEKDFDPTILKNMNVSLEGQVLESVTEIGGVKEGVKIPVTSEISGVKEGVKIPITDATLYTQLSNIYTMAENIFQRCDRLSNVNNEKYIGLKKSQNIILNPRSEDWSKLYSTNNERILHIEYIQNVDSEVLEVAYINEDTGNATKLLKLPIDTTISNVNLHIPAGCQPFINKGLGSSTNVYGRCWFINMIE